MSAPNFSRTNTSKIYAFGLNHEITQADIDENGLDQDLLGEYENDFDYSLESCVYDLAQKDWNEIDENNGDRNYPTQYFAEKSVTFQTGASRVSVIVKAGYTAAYYEGANFDFCVSCVLTGPNDYGYWCSEEYNLQEYDIDESVVIDDNWYNNKGMSKIQAKNIIKKINKAVEDLTSECEAVFAQCCDKTLACAGVFSNGEGVYVEVA